MKEYTTKVVLGTQSLCIKLCMTKAVNCLVLANPIIDDKSYKLS